VEISRRLEDAAFSISLETSLYREVKDIIDELNCIDYILRRQQDVVTSLTRMQKSRSIKTVSDIVRERRDTWASIAHTAHVACAEIQSQMDVKQKQANLSETRSSRYQAEDSARHGRIILLFTIVTIVFLPLSFLATWFGMNIRDPDAGNLPLTQIAAIIFPISLVIALSALVFAFSERLRNLIMECLETGLDLVLGGLRVNRPRSRRRRQRRRVRRIHRDVELESVMDADR